MNKKERIYNHRAFKEKCKIIDNENEKLINSMKAKQIIMFGYVKYPFSEKEYKIC